MNRFTYLFKLYKLEILKLKQQSYQQSDRMSLKLVYPTSSIKATMKVDGIFSIPDQWKATDQANPGLFTYTVRMSKFEATKGKVFPRQLSDKQKRELQQKNKKGAKKQTKKEQDTAEQQRLRKIQLQKQQERQQLFAKLSAEQQFFHTSEDSFKANILKLQNFSDQFQFIGRDCLAFQNRLTKDKGDWVYIYKVPAVSEDELAKMRKTKPKTLNNINDLNPVIMRAWVNLEALNSKTQKQITVRCKVSQVDKTAETSQPNLQKTYIKLTVSLNQPLLKDLDSYTFQSLIKDPVKQALLPAQKRCVQQLKQQLKLAVQSLAMEYSTLFWKDLNMQQQQRNSAIYVNNKKNETTRRKEQFLYDFNISGKYKILKDRIKKCIVHICQNKYKSFFQGLKTFNGIKCNSKDQIYTQIYNLLIDSYKQTLANIIFQKKEDLQEVQVLQVQTRKKNTQKILTQYRDQILIQRIKRAIRQYQILMDFEYGQKLLLRYIQQYPQVLDVKYYYAIYCIKYNLRKTNEVLPYIEQYLTKNKENLSQQVKIQYMILLVNGGGQQALSKSWVILRQIIEKNPTEAKYLMLASLLLEQLSLQELSAKYYSKAQSCTNNIQPSNHKQEPLKSEVPSIGGKVDYSSAKSQQKTKQIYQQLVQMFTKYSGFDVIQKILKKMNSSQQEGALKSFEHTMVQLSKLMISHSQQSCEKVIEISKEMYQRTNRVQALETIIKGLLLKLRSGSQRSSRQLLDELENLLKKSLVKNSQQLSRFFTLLRLGYVYLKKQQYGNAKACLLKYLQKVKTTYNEYASGLSYKILGVTYIRSQNVEEGIQCLKHANLCDTKNEQTWLYLSLGCSKLRKNIATNQSLNQYFNLIRGRKALNLEDQAIIKQICQTLRSSCPEQTFYDSTIKDKILQRLQTEHLR